MASFEGRAEAFAPPSASVGLKTAYGIGAAAFGIKNNGFDYFLLIFYGTVVGLEPGLVGLAILIALCVDALSDPLVGYWSDNLHSRWGRRHPFMYASAIPVALTYFLLWNPPDWGQAGLFIYLTLMAILIRTFITLYETPSAALIPELTSDYDERTTYNSYRVFFAWAGGNVMSVLMFGVLLTGPLGMRDQQAYQTYGIIASALIFLSIMVSAVGTHGHIKHLHQPVIKSERYTIGRIFREMTETLNDRNFFALFIATVMFAVATGASASLAFLMLNYFWGFSEFQIFIWTCTVFLAAALGFVIAPWASRRWHKKRATILLGVIGFSILPTPVVLRLAGLMPENGDPLLFPLVLTINIIDLSILIAVSIVLLSMVADLVESSQLKTGRRSEGVYYAALTFTRKTTQGIGVLIAGIILSVIDFPEGAKPSDVDPDVLWNLGAFYAPTLLVLWLGGIYCVSRYKIDKAGHEDNLRRLAELV